MKKRLWKQILGMTLAGTMLFTTPTAYALARMEQEAGNKAEQGEVIPNSGVSNEYANSNETIQQPNGALEQGEVIQPEGELPQQHSEEQTEDAAEADKEHEDQPADLAEQPQLIPETEVSGKYIVIDDTETDTNQENYFTYLGGEDNSPNAGGEKGWVADTKTGDWSSNEVATQHWVWSGSEQNVKKFTYKFTFKGTGVQLVGIKSDPYMSFKLDDGAEQVQEIAGQDRQETVLYTVGGLPNKTHTVEVKMAEGKNCHGLQVSCARVYGSALSEREQTSIPYTKRDGEVNRFRFSEQGWSAQGDDVHCWSDAPANFEAGAIWYEVDFIGSQIDIWAGKNAPHGDVSYTIFERGSKDPVQGPVTVSHYAPKNVLSAKVHSFTGLDENKVYTMRAVALGTGKGSQKIIDCGKVVVHHKPYQVTDFAPTEASYSLGEGQKQQIVYRVEPSHAVITDMQFTSKNPDIASVDEKTGLITAKKAGSTVITLASKEHSDIEAKEIKVDVFVPTAAIEGSIVDVDTQYTEDRYQEIRKMDKVSNETLTAWKNDKAVSSLALISKDSALKNVKVTASDLVSESGGARITSKNVVATFIKSTKAYNGPFLGYGSSHPDAPIPEDNGKNRSESSDILYQTDPMDIGWNEVQPVWVEFNIPVNAEPGTYTTTLSVTADGIEQPLTFSYTIHVQNAILPDATSFKDRFSIEFWHHPYASAEYYDVEPFSEAHLKVLESAQQIYKEVGGNTIYTSVVEEPWLGQTWSAHPTDERPTYPSMIRWTKHKDGHFSFNYDHFDTWVKFNIDRGLGDKIVMFSIAPWHNSFKYYDEDGKLHTESFQSVGGVGSEKYNEIWRTFLTDLIAHLEQKGWFDRAYIGIDERGFTTGAFDIVEAVKNSKGEHLKIMGYMDGINNTTKYNLALRCTDYSIGDNAAQTGHPTEYKKLLAERDKRGLKTTFYSCTEHRPGNFSLSQPVESYYSVVNTRRGGATGFARWAYDAWVPDPLEDTTHNGFEPGDCFVIYPDLKSNKDHPQAKYSVRLARMAEGVRDNNKVMLMVEQYPQLKEQAEALYNTIETNAFSTNSRYLSEAEINKLRKEIHAFKSGLVELTEAYIALGGRGDEGATGNDGTVNSYVTSVSVVGSQSVQRGTEEQLEARVEGVGQFDNTVLWSVEGAQSAKTTISSSGVLSVAEDEGADTLIVQAAAASDPSIKGRLEISVRTESEDKEHSSSAPSRPQNKPYQKPEQKPEEKPAEKPQGSQLKAQMIPTVAGKAESLEAYTDAQNHWAQDAIAWAVTNQLFKGVSESQFAPDTAMTRGMLVTVLYRLSGQPAAGQSQFKDVPATAYYNKAVSWAKELGLVNGVGDGLFAPEEKITREQFAVILHKFSGSPTVSGQTMDFSDAAKIHSWAQDAVVWAVHEGFLSGMTDGSLDPNGQATRAQVATILMRFTQKNAA